MERLFTDPFDELPAYEREIVRLRAYELTLVLYYQTEIERRILDQVECHDRWAKKRDTNFIERAPKGSKFRLKKSLKAMTSDGAITEDERKEIVKAVDFRNDVGHRIDHLFSDLEQGRFLNRRIDGDLRKITGIRDFDHQAVQRMKRIQAILDRTGQSHYRTGTFSWRGHMMFSSTERVLTTMAQKSRAKLQRLSDEREIQTKQLSQELEHGFLMLNSLREQSYFDIRFDQGRMTGRGQELCYRLFDEGLSDLAVAHIFEMKLRSIQHRRKRWLSIGGQDRAKPVWGELPAVITPSRFGG